MAVYMVGGAVRDQLLGVPVHDRDWVVVGASPAVMEAHGFTPVGKDFPVFLHPQTHEEYALARTERKSGHGYKGFTVYADQAVTIEEDLARRDLTINAIALRTLADGSQQWVDPYDGRGDVQRKVLRHVTEAFAEDPLRILRIARFAARFTAFEVAPETMALMQTMVQAGEAAHLVPERVWQELAKGLMERAPTRMFDVLRHCGALAVVLPEIEDLWRTGIDANANSDASANAGERSMQRLAAAAQVGLSLAERWAVLVVDVGRHAREDQVATNAHTNAKARKQEALHALAERLRVPSDIRDLSILVAEEGPDITRLPVSLDAGCILHLLERCDAFRRPERFEQILTACAWLDADRASTAEHASIQATLARLRASLQVAQQVATAAIAQKAFEQGLKGDKIGECIQQARTEAIAQYLALEAKQN
ncbi:multifunctional CCA addition/repair protein [Lampropedia aestuarii]|uniref:multifunctional CCA addition/repair protein n=1 Tax=Lampropedia aestuarii TaxID=2562762 RepID=UPI002469303F|nr:multifunctional CCA addition/repair protein [Lampropedia aestuarii]MDH5859152.1 multifunctional CCA addition/repair protein [Lampropedia aestuarii]